jgi:hypothetical protein
MYMFIGEDHQYLWIHSFKINGMFYSAHPNVYQIIKILLNVQFQTYIKIISFHIINTRKNTEEKKSKINFSCWNQTQYLDLNIHNLTPYIFTNIKNVILSLHIFI